MKCYFSLKNNDVFNLFCTNCSFNILKVLKKSRTKILKSYGVLTEFNHLINISPQNAELKFKKILTFI